MPTLYPLSTLCFTLQREPHCLLPSYPPCLICKVGGWRVRGNERRGEPNARSSCLVFGLPTRQIHNGDEGTLLLRAIRRRFRRARSVCPLRFVAMQGISVCENCALVVTRPFIETVKCDE